MRSKDSINSGSIRSISFFLLLMNFYWVIRPKKWVPFKIQMIKWPKVSGGETQKICGRSLTLVCLFPLGYYRVVGIAQGSRTSQLLFGRWWWWQVLCGAPGAVRKRSLYGPLTSRATLAPHQTPTAIVATVTEITSHGKWQWPTGERPCFYLGFFAAEF